jgi:hypothetical protein
MNSASTLDGHSGCDARRLRTLTASVPVPPSGHPRQAAGTCPPGLVGAFSVPVAATGRVRPAGPAAGRRALARRSCPGLGLSESRRWARRPGLRRGSQGQSAMAYAHPPAAATMAHHHDLTCRLGCAGRAGLMPVPLSATCRCAHWACGAKPRQPPQSRCAPPVCGSVDIQVASLPQTRSPSRAT